jgi:hypothetical protein
MGGSPNAELRIDGTVRGTLPLAAPLAVATGSITIELSSTGFFPRQRTTIVRARQTTRESFDPLVAVPTAVAAAPAAPPAGGGEGGAPSAEPAPVAPAAPGSRDTGTGEPSALRGSAKWIAWGLGAAAVGLGVFGYLGQNSAADDFNRDCAIDGNGNVVANMGVNPATCRDRQSSVDSNFRLEVIGFAGAAVLAGAGVTLWLTEPKPAASGTSALSCVPSVTPGGGAWMGCRLRF